MLRSLSRLRGRAGVGVLPQRTLPVWGEPPPGASRRPPPQAGEVSRACGMRPWMTRFRASFLRLADILDGLERLELDVVELAIDLLDLADVDVLHDVAGLRIDRNRAARAFPLLALHGLDQLGAVGVPAGL